jgi:hypothetical protein
MSLSRCFLFAPGKGNPKDLSPRFLTLRGHFAI